MFRSDREGGGLFVTPADGSGQAARLTTVKGPSRPAHTPYAFTPDGRSVLFTELRSYADQGIGVVDIASPPRVRMLIDGPYAETRPALSPDGAWLAYQSDETGRYEVYVRPYPDVDASRTQVSTRGGTAPRWRPDGRAIIFHDGSSMTSAPVTPGVPFVVGDPAPLFEASRYGERLGPLYDITPEGDRFLFLRSRRAGWHHRQARRSTAGSELDPASGRHRTRQVMRRTCTAHGARSTAHGARARSTEHRALSTCTML